MLSFDLFYFNLKCFEHTNLFFLDLCDVLVVCYGNNTESHGKRYVMCILVIMLSVLHSVTFG